MSIVLFLLPMQQIVQLLRGTLRPADVSYLVFIANGTMSIFFFGDFYRISDALALLPHCVSTIRGHNLPLGIPLNLGYLDIYLSHMYPSLSLLYVAASWVCTGALLGLSSFVLPLKVVVSLAVIMNVAMGLATFQKFGYVCRTQDYRVLPVSQNVYAVFCCGFWLIYGLLRGLPELVLPNVFMELISITGITFYLFYRSRSAKAVPQVNIELASREAKT